MASLDWLDRYLLPDCGYAAWDRVHRGDGRAVATDGRCILAVDDPAATFAELDVPFGTAHGFDPADANRTLRGLLAEPAPADADVTDLGDLWAWVGHLWRERCPACLGTGSFLGMGPDDPPCEECDGRRWVFPLPPWDRPDADTVTARGLPLDRNRLAWWLAGELGDYGAAPVCVWRSASAGLKSPAVAFAGPCWRLVVAASDRDVHPARYRTYLPGAGQWWERRLEPVARWAAEDWARERGADGYDLFGGHAGEG